MIQVDIERGLPHKSVMRLITEFTRIQQVVQTAQNEADYHMRRPVESGFFSHVVGNGRVMQVGPVNQGAYDVAAVGTRKTYAALS